MPRFNRTFSRRFAVPLMAISALALAGSVPASAQSAVEAPAAGVLRIMSNNSFDETVVRLKSDVQAKGIRFFDQIDQSGLGGQAGLHTARSTLVIFGNPPLGVQFLQSNRYAGLDWPVRMLVVEEVDGSVWVAWNDFAFIRDRYGIADRDAQFRMAGEVAASIATAAASR
jgi:uncharacterized protein (DUF302 family)